MFRRDIYLTEQKKKRNFLKFLIFIIFILWFSIYLPPNFYLEILKIAKVQGEYILNEILINFEKFVEIERENIKNFFVKIQNFLEKPIVGYYLFYSKLNNYVYLQEKRISNFKKIILDYLPKFSESFKLKLPKISFKKSKSESQQKFNQLDLNHVTFNQVKASPKIEIEILKSKIENNFKFFEVSFNKKIEKKENKFNFLKGQLILEDENQKLSQKLNQELEENKKEIKIYNIPHVGAKSILVKSINGKEIFVKNPGQLLSIASIVKLMTSLIAFENYEENDVFEIRKEDIEKDGDNGLKLGDKFLRDDLIKIMLLLSSNDAAYSLTQKIGEEKFVYLMNKKAKEIGMKNTIFVDSTGLSTSNKSNVDDLYTLIVYLFENYRKILEITQEKEVKIYSLRGNLYEVKNRIYKIEPLIFEEEFLGGKTGFLFESGFNFLGIFKNSDPTVFIILNDPINYFSSFKEIYNLAKEIRI